MNTSSLIHVSWFQHPQVVAIEMAQGHRVLHACSLLKVEGFELGYLSRIGLLLLENSSCNTFKSLDLILNGWIWLPCVLIDVQLLIYYISSLIQLSDQAFMQARKLFPVDFKTLMELDEWL